MTEDDAITVVVRSANGDTRCEVSPNVTVDEVVSMAVSALHGPAADPEGYSIEVPAGDGSSELRPVGRHERIGDVIRPEQNAHLVPNPVAV